VKEIEDKVKISRRLNNVMCDREPLLLPYYLLGSFYSFIRILFLILSMCVILEILVCVKWKKVILV
jgi:hypothetical protein